MISECYSLKIMGGLDMKVNNQVDLKFHWKNVEMHYLTSVTFN